MKGNVSLAIFFLTDKGLEDSMRRNAVRSIGVETCLFDQKELEQLYAVFKVCPWDFISYLVHEKEDVFTAGEGNKELLSSVNRFASVGLLRKGPSVKIFGLKPGKVEKSI